MNKLTIYHGSPEIIEKPVFGKGKVYNDYGQGFYCTENQELAKEWACTGDSNGFVNAYEIPPAGLSILNLSSEKFTVLNWLAILMQNRIGRISTPLARLGRDYLLEHFLPDYQNSDIILGYRADDSYFSFARAFVSNEISLQQLEYAMKLGKLGEQFVLKSEKAFEAIHFTGYQVADNSVYYARRKARDEEARKAFLEELEKGTVEGIFMRDILQEEMTADDLRLR